MDQNANWRNLHLDTGVILRYAGVDIPSAPTIFDAIIDPSLAASLPASHQYKNLTELVAAETSWTSQDFIVGVKQKGNVAIVEPAGIDISAKTGNLHLIGIGRDFLGAIGWDIKVGISTGLAGGQVYAQDIFFAPTVANCIPLGYFGSARNCKFGSNVIAPTSRTSTHWDCEFTTLTGLTSSAGVGVDWVFYDCITGGLTASTSLVTVQWIGGKVTGTVSSSNGLTMSGFLDASITVTAGVVDLNCTASVNGMSVFLSSGVTGRVVGGIQQMVWAGIAEPKFVDVIIKAAAGIDVTAPAQMTVSQPNAGFGPRLTLRGDPAGTPTNVNMRLVSVVEARVELIGLKHSQLLLTWGLNNGSPLTIDATSRNNLIILSGSNNGVFGGVTDLGINNRVITETSDSFLSSPTAINALRGPPGMDGQDGVDGIDGLPGRPGFEQLTGDVTATPTGVTTIKSSVALAGNPTTTTQSANDNSTKIATTAYADNVVAGTLTSVTSLVTVNTTVEASANTIIDDGSRTYLNKQYRIEINVPYVEAGSGVNEMVFNLWDGATNLGILGTVPNFTVGFSESFCMAVFVTPSAGSHQYKLKAWMTPAVAGTNRAGGQGGGAGTWLAATMRITLAP